MGHTLLIDANNIAYIAAHALGPLTSENGPTEVIYGFLSSVFNLQRTWEPDEIIFCWDSRKSYRKIAYPPYKSKRHYRSLLTDEEKEEKKIFFEQLNTLRTEILPEMGFKNNFMKVGYEGDDLIAYIVKKYKQTSFHIVSTDQDLYQLFKPNILIINPSTGRGLSSSLFVREFGIKPIMWSMVKAIAGCSSDEIKGVEGVGEKTAIKYLTGKLPKHHKTYEKITSEEGKEIKIRNKKLVTLPYAYGNKKLDFELMEQPPLLKRSFKNVFSYYDFNSFLSNTKFNMWVDEFNLKV
jgi:DNA polymerase-1